MAFFARITDIISANVNDMLDKVEDPERMIKQIIREMEENIRRARQEVLEAVTSEKQLARQLKHHQAQADQWEQKARTALCADQESLARQALARKKEHVQAACDLTPGLDAARETSLHLKSQLRALENKLETAKRKQGMLAARQRGAQARYHMDRTARHFQTGLDTEEKFSRMEDRVSRIEARAEAQADLDDAFSGLARDIDALADEADLDTELAELKNKLSR